MYSFNTWLALVLCAIGWMIRGGYGDPPSPPTTKWSPVEGRADRRCLKDWLSWRRLGFLVACLRGKLGLVHRHEKCQSFQKITINSFGLVSPAPVRVHVWHPRFKRYYVCLCCPLFDVPNSYHDMLIYSPYTNHCVASTISHTSILNPKVQS